MKINFFVIKVVKSDRYGKEATVIGSFDGRFEAELLCQSMNKLKLETWYRGDKDCGYAWVDAKLIQQYATSYGIHINKN